MYIEQARKQSNAFWLYLIGVLILGVVLLIGNVPFGVAIVAEAGIDSAQLSIAEQMKVLPSNTILFLLLLPFLVLLYQPIS